MAMSSALWLLKMDLDGCGREMSDQRCVRAVRVNVPGFVAIRLIVTTGILVNSLVSIPGAIGEIPVSVDRAGAIIMVRPRAAARDPGHRRP